MEPAQEELRLEVERLHGALQAQQQRIQSLERARHSPWALFQSALLFAVVAIVAFGLAEYLQGRAEARDQMRNVSAF